MEDKKEKKIIALIQKAVTGSKVAELKGIHSEMLKAVDFLSLSTHKFVAEYNKKVPINTACKATKIIGIVVSDMMKKRDISKVNPTETSSPMTPESQRLYSFFHEQMSQLKSAIARLEAVK